MARSKGSQSLPPKNRIDRLLAKHPRRRRSPVSRFCYQAARKISRRIAGINHRLLAILQAQNKTRSLSSRPAAGGRCATSRLVPQCLGADPHFGRTANNNFVLAVFCGKKPIEAECIDDGHWVQGRVFSRKPSKPCLE